MYNLPAQKPDLLSPFATHNPMHMNNVWRQNKTQHTHILTKAATTHGFAAIIMTFAHLRPFSSRLNSAGLNCIEDALMAFASEQIHKSESHAQHSAPLS